MFTGYLRYKVLNLTSGYCLFVFTHSISKKNYNLLGHFYITLYKKNRKLSRKNFI